MGDGCVGCGDKDEFLASAEALLMQAKILPDQPIESFDDLANEVKSLLAWDLGVDVDIYDEFKGLEDTFYIENKVRHVRNASFWGVPVGTIIAPGMKPKPSGHRSPALRQALQQPRQSRNTPDQFRIPGFSKGPKAGWRFEDTSPNPHEHAAVAYFGSQGNGPGRASHVALVDTPDGGKTWTANVTKLDRTGGTHSDNVQDAGGFKSRNEAIAWAEDTANEPINIRADIEANHSDGLLTRAAFELPKPSPKGWIAKQDQARVEKGAISIQQNHPDLVAKYGGDPYYAMWMKNVDDHVSQMAGIGVDDLSDWPSRDSYESGASPRKGALAAFSNDDVYAGHLDDLSFYDMDYETRFKLRKQRRDDHGRQKDKRVTAQDAMRAVGGSGANLPGPGPSL